MRCYCRAGYIRYRTALLLSAYYRVLVLPRREYAFPLLEFQFTVQSCKARYASDNGYCVGAICHYFENISDDNEVNAL